MRYDALVNAEDGETYFDTVEVEFQPMMFAPPAPPLDIAGPKDAERFLFVRVPAGWVGAAHPTPRRQLWVGLSGALDVSASNGETRRYGPGATLMLEDTDGKGHETIAVGDEDVYGLFVQVD